MKGTKFFAVVALAACLAAPSIAGAVCPAANTFFFSGSGVTTLATSALFTSTFPASGSGLPGIPVAFVGQFFPAAGVTQGVSCARGCSTTASANGVATEVANTASSNVPNSGAGGFDGIACNTTFSLAITANCTGTTLDSTKAVSTTLTSVPSPAGDTPALVCGALVGSTLSSLSQTDTSQKIATTVVTRNVGCLNGTVPCTMPQAQSSDIVGFNVDAIANNNF